MRVPLKSLRLAIFMFLFSFVRGEDCFSKDIKYKDTEPLEKDSYFPGETVKITCVTGHSGLYKLTCSSTGKWEVSIERPCKKKQCGHPGDTPNGDFELIDGADFAFGSTVEYKCKTGYVMESRTYRRTCRAQGWDNKIPVCEVVRCNAIITKDDVTALGNTEEASYGDVIHFECVHSNKMLDGRSDINCKENGEWSHPVPKCIEITCTPLEIPNGNIIQPAKEYKQDDILKYACNRGYRPRQGTPKCTKYGWSLNPECDELYCLLEQTSYGIKSITPEGKRIFKIGESVEITCSETYLIFRTRENKKSITCLDTGDWDTKPTCEEIRCEVPYTQHVYDPRNNFYGDLKLAVTRSYTCESGYRGKGWATCTQNGWTPDPLCTEIMCEAPKIPNADIRNQRNDYKINTNLQYKCHSGFEPEDLQEITCNSQGRWPYIKPCTAKQGSCTPPSLEKGFMYDERNSFTEGNIYYSCEEGYKPLTGNWWEEVTCKNGAWSDEQQCIRQEDCGTLPNDLHGKPKRTKKFFSNGESAEFECDAGFKSTKKRIKCVRGKWDIPDCEEDVRCNIPPKVTNAVITSKPQEFYPEGSHVTYKCRSLFTMTGDNDVFCRNATWGNTPKCEAFCIKPLQTVNNAVLENEHQDKTKYSDGDIVHYECVKGFESREKPTAKCKETKWIYPECIEVSQCSKPTMNVRFVTLLDGKNEYNNFELLRYKCKHPYNEIPEGALMCQNKTWNGTFVCTSKICPLPPDLENGDYDEKSHEESVITEVQYRCKNNYVIDTPNKRSFKCRDGAWETPPNCLKPCEITPDILQKHNVKPPADKYINHGRKYKLNCIDGWNIGGTLRKSSFEVSCYDGNLQFSKSCAEENYFG